MEMSREPAAVGIIHSERHTEHKDDKHIDDAHVGGSNVTESIDGHAEANADPVRERQVADEASGGEEKTGEEGKKEAHEASDVITPLQPAKMLNKLDMRMLIMRERFKKLELLDDVDSNVDSSGIDNRRASAASRRASEDMSRGPSRESSFVKTSAPLTRVNSMGGANTNNAPSGAAKRWGRIKKVIKPLEPEPSLLKQNNIDENLVRDNHSADNLAENISDKTQTTDPGLGAGRRSASSRAVVAKPAVSFTEEDNLQLMAFWDDPSMPSPPKYTPMLPPTDEQVEVADKEWTEREVRDGQVGEEAKEGEEEEKKEKHLGKEGEEGDDGNKENMENKVLLGGIQDGNKGAQDDRLVFRPPPLPSYEADFTRESQPLSLLINRVPRDVIVKQKERMEQEVLEEQRRNVKEFHRKESDVVWREHLARNRVIQAETDARSRVEAERERSMLLGEEKERKIGREFRRAREDLEGGVNRQLVAIRERFGDILLAGASLARKYGVQSTYAPQPVEVRIHFLRAVKTKLPKGKYVMMLTQYESLGGNPIGWSKVGSYGIGRSKAATTRPVTHSGRYFDRMMKFEDSCYALCPPSYMMKPSFVFILELFHIASWRNPTDRVVAWAALPMCNEHLNIAAGQFRIPLLRGEQNPSVEHFRSIERAISEDLNNWLCNAYIEVRCMPLSEVSDVELGGFKDARLDYDFINRVVITDDEGGKERKKERERVELERVWREKEIERIRKEKGQEEDKGKGKEDQLDKDKHLDEPMDGTLRVKDPPSYRDNGKDKEKIGPTREGRDELNRAEGEGRHGENGAEGAEGAEGEEGKSDAGNDNGALRSLYGVNGALGGALDGAAEGALRGSNKMKAKGVSFLSPRDGGGGGCVVPIVGGGGDRGGDKGGSQGEVLVVSHDVDRALSIDKELFRRKSLPAKRRRSSDRVAICDDEGVEGGEGGQGGGEEEGLLRSDSSKKYKEVQAGRGAVGGVMGYFSSFLSSNAKKEEERKGRIHAAPYSPHRTKGRASGPNPEDDFSSGSSSGDEEMIERGYLGSNEFYLDEEQRGKLSGLETVPMSMTGDERMWASSGLEGKVVRRWHSDGPRFDSEAIRAIEDQEDAMAKIQEGRGLSPDKRSMEKQTSKQLTKEMSKGSSLRFGSSFKTPVHDSSRFLALEDPKEMETYSMSLAADPSQRRHLLPQAIFATKMRFLHLESFGELSYYMWGSLRFYVTVAMFLFTFWLRLYVHFVAQYMYLQAIGTPVYGFSVQPILVVFKYMPSSISMAQEIGVVAIGPVFNIAVFVGLATLGRIFFLIAKFLPDVCSKFISCYGIATILDPLLLFIVDIAYHNYNCTSYDYNCSVDYTGNSCMCFNGDFIKLYNRTVISEGSGVTGVILVLIIYFVCAIVSTLLLYEYLVYVHKDARILDLWRRVRGPAEEFFVPDDFEVSHAELLSVCAKADGWRGLKGATRKVIVSTYIEKDPLDKSFLEQSRHYVVYEHDSDGTKTLYRHFLLQHSGCLIELFEQHKVRLTAVKQQYTQIHRALEHSNTHDQLNGLFGEKRSGSDNGNDSVSVIDSTISPMHKKKEKGLFSGLEAA